LHFDKAAISRLVLADEGVARELRAQIVEDGADFHALTREYSIHAETRPAGGYAGLVIRTDMEPALEAAVFGSQPGKIVGPI
jgi:parvulin-like peptidyl-prolyl isomerase